MSRGRKSPNDEEGGYLERMAVLGEMFAEAAHEINNVMGAASSYAELELDRDRAADTASYVPTILALTRMAGDLALNVLHFSAPVEGDVGDVEESIQAVLGLYGYRRRKGLLVETKIEKPLAPVAVPAGHLLLILANLLKNALDAVEGTGTPSVRLSAGMTGPSVVVRIWNSGPPSPPDQLRKVFMRNFTTKTAGNGSGLGLVIARRLVSAAGGTLGGANAPEGGVVFTVTLPAATTAAAGTQETTGTPTPTAKRKVEKRALLGHRILVVDDDDSMREVLKLVLSQKAGGQVTTCATGTEALRLLDTEAFDAVVLDLRMPGLSGQDTFERMPDPLKRRVVFITGDTLRSTTSTFLGLNKQPALIKPVLNEDLVHAIREVAAQNRGD